jgi:hypothetical protein
VLVVSIVKQALRGDSVGAQSGTVKLVGHGPKELTMGVDHYGRSWRKQWNQEAQQPQLWLLEDLHRVLLARSRFVGGCCRQ